MYSNLFKQELQKESDGVFDKLVGLNVENKNNCFLTQIVKFADVLGFNLVWNLLTFEFFNYFQIFFLISEWA